MDGISHHLKSKHVSGIEAGKFRKECGQLEAVARDAAGCSGHRSSGGFQLTFFYLLPPSLKLAPKIVAPFIPP